MYTDTTGSQASKQVSKQASKHTQTSERTARQTNKQPSKHTYTHNMHPFIPSMHTCFEIQRRKQMHACLHATCMSPLKLAFRSIATCAEVCKGTLSTKVPNHGTTQIRRLGPGICTLLASHIIILASKHGVMYLGIQEWDRLIANLLRHIELQRAKTSVVTLDYTD